MPYHVTIKREGNQYVARDANGSRRTWGECNHEYFEHKERRGADLAEFLFHKDEIVSVAVVGSGITEAVIDDGGE